jgi:quinol-cytochrome oxidoreductase complex cytochrome b subunit
LTAGLASPVETTLVQSHSQSISSRPPTPGSDARRSRFLLKTLVLHFRPVTVPRATLRFSFTWGLGGMAATLVLLQLGSGMLLKFAYAPTPVAAYASIQTLTADMLFGRLVRNLHYWCAHLLVAVIVLHMLRVFFTGAFHPPRRFNWIIGLGLAATILSANFTGYLLPWDQLAFWAVTVSTGMLEYVPLVGDTLQGMVRGGAEIGAHTLTTFFALHTAVLPVLLLGLMAFHFWRIRKARGLVVPRPPGAPVDVKPERSPTAPDLLLRETAVALAVAAFVLLLSTLADAPLGDQANAGLSPNPTKAPWYFAGLQELLLLLHPVFAVCVIPAFMVGGLLAFPWLPYETDTGGIWFASRPGRRMAFVAAVMGLALMPLLILMDAWLSKDGSVWIDLPPLVADGLIPTVGLLLFIGGFYAVLRRRWHATRNEALQAVFTLCLTGYGVLTLTGVWFRGEGMRLTLPW